MLVSFFFFDQQCACNLTFLTLVTVEPKRGGNILNDDRKTNHSLFQGLRCVRGGMATQDI